MNFRHVHKIVKSDSWFVMPVCLFIHMEELGSHCVGFHHIWFFSVIQKYVDKIQVPLQFDNNNRYFTWSSM